MDSHLKQHVEKLKHCSIIFYNNYEELVLICGPLLRKLLLKRINNFLKKNISTSLATKNKKRRNLLIDKVLRQERIRPNAAAYQNAFKPKKNSMPV